jgi:hypothetical protein
VAHSLYRRAVGDVDHLPDITACILWLKNRRRDLWRDRMDSTVKVVREVTTMTDDKLENVIRRGRSNGSGTDLLSRSSPTTDSSTSNAPWSRSER